MKFSFRKVDSDTPIATFSSPADLAEFVRSEINLEGASEKSVHTMVYNIVNGKGKTMLKKKYTIDIISGFDEKKVVRFLETVRDMATELLDNYNKE